MLVLTRQLEQSIVIGEGPDAITVTVTQLRGPNVRLSIQAPAGVQVHRAEIYELRQREAQEEVLCP